MSRTNGRFECKTPYTDGLVFFSADDIMVSGTTVLTRNAKGDYSWNQAASQAVTYLMPFSTIIYRLGLAPFIQEQFGTAAGVAGPTSVANTSDPDGMPSPYTPPFTRATMPTVAGPTAGFVPKGIKITDLVLHYLIGTNPLSVHTIGVSKTVFAAAGTNAALTITDVLAAAANGLATAANANPYSTKVALASPSFLVSDLASYQAEIATTTPVGGTYRLYGASVHVSYNFN